MITKNELERYRGNTVGEALVALSVAEGFQWGENNILVYLSKDTYTDVSDLVNVLDFIKSNLELKKEVSSDIIGNNMANPMIPFEINSWINYIDSKYWDILSSIIL